MGYEYDAVGNPLAKIDNLTQQPTDNYTYWPGTDKLFQINGADDRSYDPNGNTTDRAGGDIYEYDYDNMLKRVIKQDGTTYEYYYDPDGARIRKEKIQNGQLVEATNYIIDANTTYAQVILEIDDQSAIIASYTYGDDLLKMSRNGEYFYWYDGLGSVTIITDITGAVANRYTYDAYGNLLDGEYAGNKGQIPIFKNSVCPSLSEQFVTEITTTEAIASDIDGMDRSLEAQEENGQGKPSELFVDTAYVSDDT